MMPKNKKNLMVYIEPTPYLSGLIDEVAACWQNGIDVLFISENKSQKWDIQKHGNWQFFPDKFFAKLYFISKIFIKRQYAMIHLAGWSDPVCLIMIFFAKVFRIPVVIESDTSLHKVNFIKRLIKRLIYPPLLKLINLFLPGGTRQGRYLEYYGVKPKYIYPVNMTVDVKNIQQQIAKINTNDLTRIRNLYQIPENNCVYLFVGRLEKYKGIFDLITAFTDLNHPGTTLIIVGDGNMRPLIETKIATQKNIKYLGRLSENKLIEIYKVADILVLPSHFEPWGLVINEAMAAGLPVIVSDNVGCIDDLVFHKQSGIIFKNENIEELKAALEFMIKFPIERKKMGEYANSLIASWTLENEAKNICHAWNLA